MRAATMYILLVLITILSCRKEDPSDDPDNNTLIPANHDIQIIEQEGKGVFWNTVTDAAFVPRGVNYFWITTNSVGIQDRFFAIGFFNEERVRQDFRNLKARGYNTVRIFMDSCEDDGLCIGNTDGEGLNPAYLDNIQTTLSIAHEEEIYLLLTSNDLPHDGGYWEQSNEGASDRFEGYRNAHYLTTDGVESAKQYWDDLLSGLSERNARFEVILAWSLLNEQWYFRNYPPFSLSSGTVSCANGKSYDLSSPDDKKRMALEGIAFYIDEVRRVIDKYDPNALITMGFFVPDYPNPLRTGDFRYVETAELIDYADLDFFDFHAYPGEESLADIAENFGMSRYTTKPVMMGEVGAFLHHYESAESAAAASQQWIAQSCLYGFDGWLYWGLYRAPEAIGDASWGFYDADEELFDALSPMLYPDACAEELLPQENLALKAEATASEYLADEPPSQALDGNYSTQWGAGADAPQWIRIDLGQEHGISLIKLYVAQYPEGNTVHELEARTGSGSWFTLKTFSSNTADGDVIEYTTDSPVNCQYLRITTTVSPSWVAWKEIEVFE